MKKGTRKASFGDGIEKLDKEGQVLKMSLELDDYFELLDRKQRVNEHEKKRKRAKEEEEASKRERKSERERKRE